MKCFTDLVIPETKHGLTRHFYSRRIINILPGKSSNASKVIRHEKIQNKTKKPVNRRQNSKWHFQFIMEKNNSVGYQSFAFDGFGTFRAYLAVVSVMVISGNYYFSEHYNIIYYTCMLLIDKPLSKHHCNNMVWHNKGH